MDAYMVCYIRICIRACKVLVVHSKHALTRACTHLQIRWIVRESEWIWVLEHVYARRSVWHHGIHIIVSYMNVLCACMWIVCVCVQAFVCMYIGLCSEECVTPWNSYYRKLYERLMCMHVHVYWSMDVYKCLTPWKMHPFICKYEREQKEDKQRDRGLSV